MSKDEKSFFERMQERWRERKEKKEGRVKEIEESGEEVVWVMGVPHRKTDPEFREWVSEHKDPEVEHSLEEGPNGNVDIISEDVLNSFTPSGEQGIPEIAEGEVVTPLSVFVQALHRKMDYARAGRTVESSHSREDVGGVDQVTADDGRVEIHWKGQKVTLEHVEMDWNGYVFSWDGKSLQWKRR